MFASNLSYFRSKNRSGFWKEGPKTIYDFRVVVSRHTYVNPRTYKGGGGGVDATPYKFFLSFSQGIKHQHAQLTFSVAVRSFLAQILRRVLLAIVTRHEVIGSRWSSQFSVKKTGFFQLLSTMKVNLVANIMQGAYLYVIFHVKHQKIKGLN